MVLVVPDDVVLAAGGDGGEVQIVAGIDLGLAARAAVADDGGGEGDVVACGGEQFAGWAADVKAGDAFDGGAGKAAWAGRVFAVAGGGYHINIAPGDGGQTVGGVDAAAEVVDILMRRQCNVPAADAAAQIPDIGGVNSYQLSPGERAAVDDVAADVEVDGLTGQQAAGPVDVARLHADVDLRYQHGLDATVRQGHFLRDQPHDVAGQLCDLRVGERHPGDQVPFLRIGQPGVHQRAVLRFVVGVALEEAATGQLRHLLADQALFVEAVAQTLLHEGGVHSELPQQVVGTEPGAVIGKARVGFDQVARRGVGIGLEQRVAGQRGGGNGADRGRAAGVGESGAAASGGGVLCQLCGGEIVGGAVSRGRIVGGDGIPPAAMFVAKSAARFDIGELRRARVGGDILPLGGQVGDTGAAKVEQAAGDDVAVLVEDATAGQNHIPARKHLAGLGGEHFGMRRCGGDLEPGVVLEGAGVA